jgi:hypothetical protein
MNSIIFVARFCSEQFGKMFEIGPFNKLNSMKKHFILALFGLSIAYQGQTQKIDLNKIGGQVLNTVTGNTSSGGGINGLSNADIVKGLKEALSVGSKNAGSNASKVDGYWKNNLIRIPFPKEAEVVKTYANKIGLSNQVASFEKTLNRAAEEAAKEAAPIFVNAITGMSIQDGVGILKGGDNAATTFLKNRTSNDLKAKFRPAVKRALEKVQITKYWNPIISKYNQVPFVRKMNPNLEDYVTQKALDGLFLLVGQEEAKIRKDPVARVNDILKKVFGALK